MLLFYFVLFCFLLVCLAFCCVLCFGFGYVSFACSQRNVPSSVHCAHIGNTPRTVNISLRHRHRLNFGGRLTYRVFVRGWGILWGAKTRAKPGFTLRFLWFCKGLGQFVKCMKLKNTVGVDIHFPMVLRVLGSLWTAWNQKTQTLETCNIKD